MVFRVVDGLVQLFECASFNEFVSNSIEVVSFLLLTFRGHTSCNQSMTWGVNIKFYFTRLRISKSTLQFYLKA